jgi:hypothetical protein
VIANRARSSPAKTPGCEADDFLAAAVAAEERPGGTVLAASGDRDAFQLASSRTTILYPSRGGEIARIGPEEVRQRYGVEPKQVPDFIALRGDPSDKLPGAAGVGPKRAAQLVRRYGTLDGVLDAGLFRTQAETLRLYRLIATMDAAAPLPSLADQARHGPQHQPCAQLGAETMGQPLVCSMSIRDVAFAQIPVIARRREESAVRMGARERQDTT